MIKYEKMSLTQHYNDGQYATQNGHTGGGFSSKLDGFMDKRELPMYKDKPYNYAGSQRSKPFYLRRRMISAVILILFGLAYWFGLFESSVRPRAPNSERKAWSWLGGSDRVVDWDYRREKVKEAFILSWDGYEKYAWGMSDPFLRYVRDQISCSAVISATVEDHKGLRDHCRL